jgi:2-oxoglutarate dehydrogenase E2 component (dihydrolipoamide succinyltransferase)
VAAGPRAGAGYSPVVRRIAAEHGVDPALVAGTGREGRVRKEDVLAYVAAGAPHGGAGAEIPSRAAEREGSPEEDENEVREPLSRMRRTIAEHMTRSLRTAAHCTTIIEVDMGRVEAARAVAGLSPLPYVARCAVASLGVFGRLNATLEGDVLTRYRDVDLGVAVSLGERGLIVPVVRRAQDRSVAGLAAEIGELARRARAGELGPDEVRGATFTITNPGRWGTIGATPIINQPQVAILDLEAVVRRPVVVGGEAIAIRPMANLCLSWDHRALDGMMAAEFLADVRARIEGWEG